MKWKQLNLFVIRKNEPPTQDRIRELFDYREDGNLICKFTRGGNAKVGTVAGCPKPSGYNRMRIDGIDYELHRIIFLYHYGYLTVGMDVDHIDNDKKNNRIENLRECTRGQNQENSKLRSNSTTGVKGVIFDKKRKNYRVNIKTNGKNYHGGSYLTLEEATTKANQLRKELHGDFARHE
jgi:hypothetical protein